MLNEKTGAFAGVFHLAVCLTVLHLPQKSIFGYSNSMGNKRRLFWILLFINPAIIALFWANSSGQLVVNNSPSSILLGIGRLAGLLAVYCVLLQLILIGRVKWVEQTFGLDKLSIVHHYNGYAAFFFMVSHALLITLSYSSVSNVSLYSQLVDFFYNYGDVWQAMIALCLFVLIIVFSVAIVRTRMKYEAWYFIHLLTYAAILLAYGHQLKLGGDFSQAAFSWYWYALYAFAVGNLVFFRFFRPLFNFWKHRFTVEKIARETHDTVSVYIGGQNLASFPAHSGQFMIVRFLQRGFWWQAHPFSLSHPPTSNFIRLTIKNVGDYTSRIPELKAGTRVIIDGPHGVFTRQSAQRKEFLLIAGGVGITPIRSLLQELAEEGSNVVLLYGNKTDRDIIFEQELARLQKRFGITIHHIMSAQGNWNGLQGKIDKEMIGKLVPDAAAREVFLCGPPPMMKSVKASLQELGLPKEYIHYEKFSLA